MGSARGLNLEPPSVFKLQPISISHGNRLRKVEKNIFTLIRRQAKAAAMARVKIESERSCCLFLRPMPAVDERTRDERIPELKRDAWS